MLPAKEILRDILACLMCSPIYFELRLQERLDLVKSLTSNKGE